MGGALALASAFALKRPQDIRAEASAHWGQQPYLVISLAKQTADAWIGGLLLTAGFAGQFAGSVGASDWGSLTWLLPIAFAITLATLSLLYTVVRPWNVRRVIERVLAAERAAGRVDEWKARIIWLSRAQGREIREGESPAALAIWLVGSRRWKRLSSTGQVPADVIEPYRPG